MPICWLTEDCAWAGRLVCTIFTILKLVCNKLVEDNVGIQAKTKNFPKLISLEHLFKTGKFLLWSSVDSISRRIESDQ